MTWSLGSFITPTFVLSYKIAIEFYCQIKKNVDIVSLLFLSL